MDQEENLEEKLVTRRIAKPKGVRLWFSLAMVLLGIVLLVAGFFAESALEIRLVLIVGGLALIFGFGWVAIGGNRINFKGSPDGTVQAGVEVPQDTTVRTTIRKSGFPKQGTMPPKQGTMPPKDGDPDPGSPE